MNKQSIAVFTFLAGLTAAQAGCATAPEEALPETTAAPTLNDPSTPGVHLRYDDLIPMGADFLSDGTLIWVFHRAGHVIGVVGQSTEAAAIAFANHVAPAGTQGGIYFLGPVQGAATTTTVLATETGAATVTGTAVYTTVGGALATGAVAVAVAVPVTLAIDTYMNNGEPVWTTIANAGGYKILLGYDYEPSVSGAYITTACGDNSLAGITTGCTIGVGTIQTGYYSWVGGSYWTCAQMWNDGTQSGDQLWNKWLNFCNNTKSSCITNSFGGCNAPKCAVAGTFVGAKQCSMANPPCCNAQMKTGGKCGANCTCG